MIAAAPPLPAPTGDDEADLAAFLAWELDRERHYYPERFAADGQRLPTPRTFTYYLGGRPSWLGDRQFDGVPLMIAAPTLARYRTSGFDKREGAEVPDHARRWGRWFGDSGAFMALTGSGTNRGDAHPWWMHADDYGSMWVRIMDDFGRPDFVAPQDWPCEPICLKRTGATVREHIEWTVENFLYLREEFPMVPWIPVIQGWTRDDYLYCEQLYLDAGVDLAGQARVGIGSICRRGHVPEIVDVIRTFADRGYRLHGFGVKITALPIIGHLLASADSYAWSDTARKEHVLLPGCEHLSRPDKVTGERKTTDCRNCPTWAIEWRRRVLATLPVDGDAPAGDVSPAGASGATTSASICSGPSPAKDGPAAAVPPAAAVTPCRRGRGIQQIYNSGRSMATGRPTRCVPNSAGQAASSATPRSPARGPRTRRAACPPARAARGPPRSPRPTAAR